MDEWGNDAGIAEFAGMRIEKVNDAMGGVKLEFGIL